MAGLKAAGLHLHESTLYLPNIDGRVEGLSKVHHNVCPKYERLFMDQFKADLPQDMVVSGETIHLHQRTAHTVCKVVERISRVCPRNTHHQPQVLLSPHLKSYPISGVAWKPVAERLVLSKKAAVTQSSQLPVGLAVWNRIWKLRTGEQLTVGPCTSRAAG